MRDVRLSQIWRPQVAQAMAAWMACALAFPALNSLAANKVKLHGYLTSRADAATMMILDDRIELSSASHVAAKDAVGEHPIKPEELVPGMLVEAEGMWLDKHKFFAEKITVDLKEDEKKIRGTAYLQEEPADAPKMASGQSSELKVDGYWLQLNKSTKRDWSPAKVSAEAPVSNAAPAGATLAGYHVKYEGVRRK